MSPIAIGLDLLLAGLLIAALVMGYRLQKRLTALRDGQAAFGLAISELDAAATKAKVGLSDLKAASEDTHDQLLARIDTARSLAGRIDTAVANAERAAARADEAARALSARLEEAANMPLPVAPLAPFSSRTPGASRIAELTAMLDAADQPAVAPTPARIAPPQPLPDPRGPARRRPVADEDLFASDNEPLRLRDPAPVRREPSREPAAREAPPARQSFRARQVDVVDDLDAVRPSLQGLMRLSLKESR